MRARDYGSYVEDIIEHMSYAEEFIKSMSFEEFSNDREKYPEIPWRDMAGIRDRLVHGYFKVNLEIVWVTVTIEFPELRPKMEEVLLDVDL